MSEIGVTMKKHISLCIAATAAFASPAFSGGYVVPIVQAPIQPVVETVRPSFSWTGVYVGGYLGHAKMNVKATGPVQKDPLIVEHEAITKEIPAEVIEHPAVTEERVVREIEHPAVTEKVPAVTVAHPEVRGPVQTGWEDVQTGTQTVQIREDVYRDENGVKQRDESHPTGWRHVPVYEDVPVIEHRPVYEDRVLQDAWVETVSPEHEVVVKAAWTEKVTQTVVVEPARTEIVKPAQTVVVKDAWTEVVQDNFAEQLTDSFTSEANSFGLFAGYRQQWRNNIVGGIEANYGRNNANSFSFADTGAFELGKDIYGVEVQMGYAIKRALPYVAVGYANVLDHGALSLSAGLDYAINDRLVIGAKYTHYDIGDLDGIDSPRNFKADGDVVSLRAAIKF